MQQKRNLMWRLKNCFMMREELNVSKKKRKSKKCSYNYIQ